MVTPRLYRPDQVAVIIARSIREVYRLIQEGKLQGHSVTPGRRGLRVTAESLDRFLEEFKIPAEKWSE